MTRSKNRTWGHPALSSKPTDYLDSPGFNILWWLLTLGHRFPACFPHLLAPVWNPISSSSQSYWSIDYLQYTAGGSKEEVYIAAIIDSTLGLTDFIILPKRLTCINCHSFPQYTLSLTQVMTIKTVLTRVSALHSTHCYFGLTLRGCMLFPASLWGDLHISA